MRYLEIFDNGYGVSIIDDGYGSSDGLYEVAVTDSGGSIVKDTPITADVCDDVIGGLDDIDIRIIAEQIKALPPRH